MEYENNFKTAQSNTLITYKDKLSVIEYKIFYSALVQVQLKEKPLRDKIIASRETEKKRYRLSDDERKLLIKEMSRNELVVNIAISDFIRDWDANPKNAYTQIRKYTDTIAKKGLSLPTVNDDNMEIAFEAMPFFVHTSCEIGSPYIELKINPLILPYIIALNGEFTLINISLLKMLDTASQIRLYEILKQQQVKGKISYSITRLKELMFCSNKYNNIADFKINILQPVLDKINRLDINVSYDIKGRGKMAKINFVIKAKKNKKYDDQAGQAYQQGTETEEEKVSQSLKKLINNNILDLAIENVGRENSQDYIEYVIGIVADKINSGNEIKNPQGYIMTIIANKDNKLHFYQLNKKKQMESKKEDEYIIDKYLNYLREDAEKKTKIRKEMIFNEFERIKQIEDLLAQKQPEMAKNILYKGKDSSECKQIEDEINKLKEEENSILKINGYNDCYLKTSYLCESCKDTGRNEKTGQRCSCLGLRAKEAKIWFSNT